MLEFSQRFTVHSFEVDARGRMTLRALANFLQEVAGNSSANLGVSMARLAEEDLAWVLHRMKLEVDGYPEEGTELVATTWPTGFDRLMATRDWRVETADGGSVCRASSQWLMVDMKARRLARLPKWVQQLGTEQRVDTIEPLLPIEKTKLPKVDPVDCEAEFRVRRGDLDLVGHVNNTRYIEWVGETVPDEVFDRMQVEAMEILFRREAHRGDLVTSRASAIDGGFAHRLLRDEEELVQATTRWRKS